MVSIYLKEQNCSHWSRNVLRIPANMKILGWAAHNYLYCPRVPSLLLKTDFKKFYIAVVILFCNFIPSVHVKSMYIEVFVSKVTWSCVLTWIKIFIKYWQQLLLISFNECPLRCYKIVNTENGWKNVSSYDAKKIFFNESLLLTYCHVWILLCEQHTSEKPYICKTYKLELIREKHLKLILKLAFSFYHPTQLCHVEYKG
jgi:hypothetical protein